MSTASADHSPSISIERVAEASPTQGDEVAQTGNLDKIRDILFGAQVRDHERRFSALEHNLVREATALRTELTKRFDALEAFIQQEVAVLSDRLQQEQQARGEAVQKLLNDLTGLGRTLERRADELAQQTTTTEEALRRETLDHVATLTRALEQAKIQLTESLNQSVQHLSHSKTDRHALSSMLSELSAKLKHDHLT
ncbi:MAG: hypothetical protein U0412_00585 [Nitrospira sp.]